MAAGMTCAESEELLALSVLGVLPAAEGQSLDAHLAACPGCRETGRAFREAASLLTEALPAAPAPASLRRRLLSDVYSAAAAPTRVRWSWRTLWRSIPQGRPLTLLAGAAVVAAAVLAAWGVARGGATPQRTYPVVGTTTDPQAAGTLVYFPAVRRSILTVTGLPPMTPSGTQARVYELWLVPHRGAPVPAAFLTESPGARTWSAVISGALPAYAAVAATAEPPGGSPGPTGPQLMSVQLSE